jgi:hypothetical protein
LPKEEAPPQTHLQQLVRDIFPSERDIYRFFRAGEHTTKVVKITDLHRLLLIMNNLLPGMNKHRTVLFKFEQTFHSLEVKYALGSC